MVMYCIKAVRPALISNVGRALVLNVKRISEIETRSIHWKFKDMYFSQYTIFELAKENL